MHIILKCLHLLKFALYNLRHVWKMAYIDTLHCSMYSAHVLAHTVKSVNFQQWDNVFLLRGKRLYVSTSSSVIVNIIQSRVAEWIPLQKKETLCVVCNSAAFPPGYLPSPPH